MSDTNTVQFKCTIKKMFNGCPKPDGWFGCFAHIRTEGKDIKLTGKTNINLMNGMQIDVTAKKNTTQENTYDVVDLSVVTKTKTGLISYLSSLSGVSRHTATAIVAQYGNDTLDMIKNNIQTVKDDLDLTDKQINAIQSGVNNADDMNTLRSFLPELSAQLIKRVKEHLTKPQEEIRNNPYILHSIPGISFQMADAVALRLGIDPASPFRINHALVHVLESQNDNNLYVNLSNFDELKKLYYKLEQLLRIRFTGFDEFAQRIIAFSAIDDSPIILDQYNGEIHLYLTDTYNRMITVINNLRNAKNLTSSYDYLASSAKMDSLSRRIRNYEITNGMKLTNEQYDAIKDSIKKKLSIITGGPGRGKTTIIDCLASLWPGDVILLAPTGKAMNKLRNATHFKFKTYTIDKLLVLLSITSKVSKKSNKFNDINSSRTLIVTDESSMLDLLKMSDMFTYLNLCNFCFIGDIDQLPPISPGFMLKDMIDSKVIQTSYLTKPLRNGGAILSNADKINANDSNLTYDFDTMPFFPQADDNEDALSAIIDQYNDERIDCPDITQLALLCPMRKGILGTINLNIKIQDIMCPMLDVQPITVDIRRQRNVYSTKGTIISNTIYGNGENYTKFRVGDIVMCTKNNNELETFTYTNNDWWNGDALEKSVGVYNGDCGKIIAYYPADLSFGADSEDSHDFIVVQFFDNRIVKLDCVNGDFESFDLGYALTVHKSQGCEYQTVICVMPKSMLNFINTGFANKNILYTAVTRARQRFVLMGSKEATIACIEHNILQPNSNVKERII